MNKISKLLANQKFLIVIAVLLVVFNIVDAGVSYWAICVVKIAREANPFMRSLLETSPILFFVTKITFSSFAAVFLYRLRKNSFATIGLFASFLGYFALVIFLLTEVVIFVNI